jgi:hypothetical protein
MFEGKIHAIITSLIGARQHRYLDRQRNSFTESDDKWYLGLLMGVLVITLTIILDIHYINPDYGLDAAEEHPILYGRPGYTPKSFDEYSEGEVWLWRLDGYFIQLFLFALSITPLIISWTR